MKYESQKITEIQYHNLILFLHHYSCNLPKNNKYRVTNYFEDFFGNTIKFHINKYKERKAVLLTKKEDFNEKIFTIFFETLKINKKLKIIGNDEVGKSDFFGPLVISSVFIKNNLEYNIKDSKKINHQTAQSIFNSIKNHIEYKYKIINSQKLNKYKVNNLNLNHILFLNHLNLMGELNINDDWMVIDDFTNGKTKLINDYHQKTEKYITKKINLEKLVFVIKGDTLYDECKIASIVSKVLFFQEIQIIFNYLKQIINLDSPKALLGCSNQVKNLIFKLKKKIDNDKLKTLIKPIYWEKFNLI